jgi:hypothetical protein
LEASPLTSSAYEALGSSTIEQGVSSNLLFQFKWKWFRPLKPHFKREEKKGRRMEGRDKKERKVCLKNNFYWTVKMEKFF